MGRRRNTAIEKVCNSCKRLLPISKYKPRSAENGRPRHICAECDKRRADSIYASRKSDWRVNSYRRKYGITISDWESIYEKQGGVCAVCKTSDPGGMGDRLQVDHCHETGRIRGLLCYHCNTAIGLMRDNPERLRNAAAYLSTFDPQGSA